MDGNWSPRAKPLRNRTAPYLSICRFDLMHFPLALADSAPRYLLRDRIFGDDFGEQVKAMGIKQVLSAPRSPWQRAYVEASSAPFAGSVWITSSSSHTWHCRRTARNPAVSNHQKPARSSRSRRLAVFTIATSAELPEEEHRSRAGCVMFWVNS
jgi:hypothetical protein